jgi:hypothetical protein
MIRLRKPWRYIMSRSERYKRRSDILKKRKRVQFSEDELAKSSNLSSAIDLIDNYSVEEDTLTVSNTLRPVTKAYTEAAIQKIIKQRITRDMLKRFYEDKISRSNIDTYRKLFESNRYLKVSAERRKYLHDLAVAVLYEELMSISQVDNILLTAVDPIGIFEKMIVLEYELYTLESAITETAASVGLKDKIYVVDNTPHLFFNIETLVSYRDRDNIEDEINLIISSINIDTLKTEYDNFNEITDSGETGKFDGTYIIRMNEKLSKIEEESIPLFSLILNYTKSGGLLDQRLLRMYYALNEDTPAYYSKVSIDGTSIDISLIETGGIDLRDYSFYGILATRGVNNINLKTANAQLQQLWDRILEGTINY